MPLRVKGSTVYRETTFSARAPWVKHGTWRVEKPLPGFDGRTYGKSRPTNLRVRRIKDRPTIH